MVDTGSDYTIIRQAAVDQLQLKVDTKRPLPSMKGVTGNSVRLLGAALVEIAISKIDVVKRWIPIVPNSYLDTDVLLGCDILYQYPFYADLKAKVFHWGLAPYHMRIVKKKRGSVRRMTTLPPPVKGVSATDNVRLKSSITLESYQTKFIPVEVSEKPGTELIIYPQEKVSQWGKPFCVRVGEEGIIPYPCHNDTKRPRILKVGTLLGHYEVGNPEGSARIIKPVIHNDLIPHHETVKTPGNRMQHLRELFSQHDTPNLTNPQRESLKKVVENHDQLFLLEEGELGTMNTPPSHIHVQDPQPVRGPMYRYPENSKEIIQEMLEDMEKKGVIEKTTSAWLSPIVLVNKPDGTKRMCLDYRRVNTHLATDIYPLPRLDELVEQAAGNQYYTTLDMKDAYFQVRLDEQSRDLTAFSDGVSLYRFSRLPFGLSCSPAIFSRNMAQILSPLLKEGWVRNYLDDIIMWAPDFPTMIRRIEKVFDCLSQGGVKLNLKKCKFGEKEVKFLGHVVSAEGSKPDPGNVEAVEKCKRPTNPKGVRRFLGMCGFYRRHIPQFAKIAAPLTDLTRKNTTFEWTPKCQTAFLELKRALVSTPVLVRADLDQPFIVTTDASNSHVGGVLSQIQPDGTNKPVGYFSKKLGPAEKRYSATDKEALGVVLTCRNFHHFLWGSRFEILTDHQPLITIFKKKTKCPRMNRWILEMREYNYNIQYVKGKNNVVADKLSRPVRIVRVENEQDKFLGKTLEEIKRAQREDRNWGELIHYLEEGKIPRKSYPKVILHQFTLDQGILYYVKEKLDKSLHYCLVVPKSLVQEALNCAHVQAGHLGQKKTIHKAEELFYWSDLKANVCKFVKECVVCQQTRGGAGLQQEWQELPPVDRPLERVGLDLIDMVASSQGHRYVLTVIDHYSRYLKLYTLKHKHTHGVVEALERFMADFGTPAAVVTDNGGEFTSKAFEEFCSQRGVAVHRTTPYHPRGNSVVERSHRTIKAILAALCRGQPLQWPKYLAACQQVLNGAVHTTLGCQPYFAFFGRHAPRSIGARLPALNAEAEDIALAHKLIRQTHSEMCKSYREKANRGRKNQAVALGTLVWVKSEVTTPGTCRKLNVKWLGPFKVVEVIREGGAYLVENVFTGKTLQRAAEKVKPYYGSSQWLLEMEEKLIIPEEEENEPLPPRVRRPPRRLIEECE